MNTSGRRGRPPEAPTRNQRNTAVGLAQTHLGKSAAAETVAWIREPRRTWQDLAGLLDRMQAARAKARSEAQVAP